LFNFRVTGNEKSGHGIEIHRINEVFINGISVTGMVEMESICIIVSKIRELAIQ